MDCERAFSDAQGMPSQFDFFLELAAVVADLISSEYQLWDRIGVCPCFLCEIIEASQQL